MDNYTNVTDEWLKNRKPRSHNITHAKGYVDDNGIFYVVDNKKNGVYFDKKSKDYSETMKCMKILRNIFGGKLQMQPIVNVVDGVSTCDFKWLRPNETKYEKWDLKTVEGSSKETLDSMIKKKKRQSHNFIFDIKNHTISEIEAKCQIMKIINSPYRQWIEKIMLIDKDEVILVYEKNEMPSSQCRTTSHL